MTDKRGYVRHITKGSIKLKTQEDARGALKSDLLDISSKGLSVSLKESIELGSIVEFELTIGSTEKVFKGQGKVVNVIEASEHGVLFFRAGIEFIGFDRNEALEMMHLIFVHKNR